MQEAATTGIMVAAAAAEAVEQMQAWLGVLLVNPSQEGGAVAGQAMEVLGGVGAGRAVLQMGVVLSRAEAGSDAGRGGSGRGPRKDGGRQHERS